MRYAILFLVFMLGMMGCARKPTPAPAPVPALADTVKTIAKPPVRVLPTFDWSQSRISQPIIVSFDKGGYKVTVSDSVRLSRLRFHRPVMVTGYASNERSSRPVKIEAERNFILSLKRAKAVCAALPVPCTPVAGGETSVFGDLAKNRIAGFIP